MSGYIEACGGWGGLTLVDDWMSLSSSFVEVTTGITHRGCSLSPCESHTNTSLQSSASYNLLKLLTPTQKSKTEHPGCSHSHHSYGSQKEYKYTTVVIRKCNTRSSNSKMKTKTAETIFRNHYFVHPVSFQYNSESCHVQSSQTTLLS